MVPGSVGVRVVKRRGSLVPSAFGLALQLLLPIYFLMHPQAGLTT